MCVDFCSVFISYFFFHLPLHFLSLHFSCLVILVAPDCSSLGANPKFKIGWQNRLSKGENFTILEYTVYWVTYKRKNIGGACFSVSVRVVQKVLNSNYALICYASQKDRKFKIGWQNRLSKGENFTILEYTVYWVTYKRKNIGGACFSVSVRVVQKVLNSNYALICYGSQKDRKIIPKLPSNTLCNMGETVSPRTQTVPFSP